MSLLFGPSGQEESRAKGKFRAQERASTVDNGAIYGTKNNFMSCEIVLLKPWGESHIEGNEWVFYSWFQGSQDFTHCAATSDAVAVFVFVCLFVFHRIRARERKGTKAPHLLLKMEEGSEGALK